MGSKLKWSAVGLTRKSRLVAATIVLGVSVADAQNSTRTPAKGEAWRASSGGFQVVMIVSDKPEAFVKEWSQPRGSVPTISSVDGARRGDTVVAFVVFTGCKAEKGRCNSTVDFELLRPDRSVYAEERGVELWKGKPPPDGNLQLSVGNLGFTVEAADPIGTYLLNAHIHDLNAKLTVAVHREIEVLP